MTRVMRNKSPVFTLGLTLLTLMWGVSGVSANVALQPTPDAAALAEATALVNDVYRELLNVKTDADRLAAARVLIMRGDETHNAPAAKYVLYDTARSLGVAANDITTANDAMDAIEKHFIADLLDQRMDAVLSVSRSARTDEQHTQVAQAALRLVEQLVIAERYDDAANLLTRTRPSAVKSKRPEINSAYKEVPEQLRVIKTEATRIAADLAAFEQRPDDPALNLSVGRFVTFYKGDWTLGLPMLAKASDPKLSHAAKLDLAGATETKAQMAIGDQWWGLAVDNDQPIERRALQERARQWYRFAVPNTSGIERSMLNNRLAAEGGIKWGDLSLVPGIAMKMEPDGDAQRAVDLPDHKQAAWVFAQAPQGVTRSYRAHFDGYLYTPNGGQVTLDVTTSRCELVLQVNGQDVAATRGRSRQPIQLIKGYNSVRGHIQLYVRHFEMPGDQAEARLSLVSNDGRPIEIPPEHWFRVAK